MTRIQKLYLSNLLTGLVFWYGIEKLFMQSVGINATGIGIVSAFSLGLIILLDIPSGLLADRWSRKGQLMISAAALAVSSIVFGLSTGLTMYLGGCVLYVIYLVNTSGTYQAIIYDVLHEEKRTNQYSKVMGKAYALFLCGAGLANIASGFIAKHGLQLPFFLSIIPPLLNIVVLASINEPTFHKDSQKEKYLLQFKDNLIIISRNKLVRSLSLIWAAFAVIGTFTLDFGQLYILEFTDSSVYLGLAWAIFAFALAAGSYIAHKVHAQLGYIIIGAMILIMSLTITQSSWGLILFMLYAVANTAAIMLVEAKIQDSTPSAVRASILSFLSTLGRLISLPAALIMGWLINTKDIFWVISFVAIIALFTGIYWLLIGSKRLKHNTT